jgi:glycosyltransferase involved in cell wall biosynthesis
MNCCICGTVRNCGPYLKKVLENIEKIGSIFNDYKIVFYYDNSTDNTLEILKNYQKQNPRLLFYVNKVLISPFRTHRLAHARNYCLNYVKSNKETFPYFIMMDLDDVSCKNLNIEPLKRCLKRNDWDGLSFNTSPRYYDVWALSIKPYYFSYIHFLESPIHHHLLIANYVDNILKNMQKNKLLKCLSSFNGFSIYRTEKFLKTYYDGRIRLDIMPKEFIQLHSNVAKSKLVYKRICNVDGRQEDCEHRSFHTQAVFNSGARIRISPEVLFT